MIIGRLTAVPARWWPRIQQLGHRRGTAVLATAALFGVAGAYLVSHARALLAFSWRLQPESLAAALVGTLLLAPLIRVWLWQYTLRSLGAALSFPQCFRIARLSQLAKYLPGQVWHYVGIVYLTTRQGVSGSTAVASLLYDQGASLVAASLVVAVTVAVTPPPVGYWAIGLLTTASLVLGVVFFLFGPASRRLLRFRVAGWAARRSRWSAAASASPLLPVRTGAALVALNVVFWMVLGGSFFFLVAGVASPGIPLGNAVAFGTLGVVAGFFAPFVPSGVGVTEGVYVWLLSPFFPVEVCLAISVLFRVMMVSKEILLAALAIGIERRAGGRSRGGDPGGQLPLGTSASPAGEDWEGGGR